MVKLRDFDPINPDDLVLGLAIVAAVGLAIHDQEILPLATLYTRLQITLTKVQIDACLSVLVKSGQISITSDKIIYWTGPTLL